MNGHGLERTNPKGETPFIGRCVYCGKDGLPMSAVNEPCDKAPDQGQQVLDAIEGGARLQQETP